MDHTRIRWSNLGRLVAGLGVGGLAIAALPGLLEPAEPPPLPADVGLSASASPPGNVALPRPSGSSKPLRVRERVRPPDVEPATPRQPDTRRATERRRDQDPVQAPAAPPPAPAAASPPVPVAAPPPSAPAAPPPEEPEEPEPTPDPPAQSPPSEPATDDTPSQFGFEH